MAQDRWIRVPSPWDCNEQGVIQSLGHIICVRKGQDNCCRCIGNFSGKEGSRGRRSGGQSKPSFEAEVFDIWRREE